MDSDKHAHNSVEGIDSNLFRITDRHTAQELTDLAAHIQEQAGFLKEEAKWAPTKANAGILTEEANYYERQADALRAEAAERATTLADASAGPGGAAQATGRAGLGLSPGWPVPGEASETTNQTSEREDRGAIVISKDYPGPVLREPKG